MSEGTKRPSFPHLPAEGWELFLRDELGENATVRIEEHVASCDACREVLERRDPSRIFGRLGRLRVRPDVWAGAWDELEAALPPRPVLEQPVRRTAGERLAAVAGIACTFVLAAGLFFAHPEGPAIMDAACPAQHAELRAELGLTLAECEKLFGVDFEDAPVEFVRSEVELEKLL